MKNNHIVSVLAGLIMASSSVVADDHKNQQHTPTTSTATLTGDYLGFTVGDKAEVFAPEVVSTEHAELSATFSKDGNEFFYAMSNHLYDHYVLVHRERINGIWQAPEIAPFSGKYMDAEPMFSPDGKRLYYISKRPRDGETDIREDYDIWYSEKTNGQWGKAINVGLTVNTDQSEYYISVTNDYTLYYSANYENNTKNSYLYKAKLVDGKYQVSLMPKSVNGKKGGIDPYTPPNEDMLLFTAEREGGYGGKDLYVAFKENNQWSEAINMGPKVNTSFREYCPSMSPDGKYVFLPAADLIPLNQSNALIIKSLLIS